MSFAKCIDLLSTALNVRQQLKQLSIITNNIGYIALPIKYMAIIVPAKDNVFSARHRPIALCYRPSVCLSVTRVDHTKTMMKILPYSSPIFLVFVGEVSSRNSDGFPPNRSVKEGSGGENRIFSSFKQSLLSRKRQQIRPINDYNRKSHMSFRLTPRSMTLDDPELL